MKGTRVLLADDHTLLLGAFEKLLSDECDVVGQVSDFGRGQSELFRFLARATDKLGAWPTPRRIM